MKTLRQVLGDATDEQLAAIFRLWVMTGEQDKKGTKQQLEMLTNRMQTNPIAARFVWDQLTDDERQVLYRVLPPSARYGIRSSSLIKNTKLSPIRYETALNHLIEYALLQEVADRSARSVTSTSSAAKSVARSIDTTMITAFNESVDVLYQVSREFFTPSGDRSKWDLVRLVVTLPPRALTDIMKNYNFPQKKSAYYYEYDDADMVADHLIDMSEPLDYLPHLEPKARELFVWLRKHDGNTTVQAARDAMKVDDATLLEMLRTLALHGLVFDSFSKGVHVVFVPRDFYNNMNSLTASNSTHIDVDDITLNDLENEPSAIRAAESIAVYDIATLVNTIYQQTIEPTQAGRVPKRISTKIRTTLRGQPRLDYVDGDDYIEILLNVMEYLNIAHLTNPSFQESKPAYEITPAIEKWAQKSLVEQTHALISYWLENFAWRDVYGVNYSSWSTYSWDVSGGRKALMKHLYNYTPGRWYRIDLLLQEIWREDAFAYRSSTSLYGRSTKIVRDADTREKWDRCEGEVYRGILSSTLYELGFVDIGYKDPDALSSNTPINPDYFMITELGREVLSLGAPGAESRKVEEHVVSRGLVIQPNFELLLLQPDLSTLYALLSFVQANQLGLVSRLTLTKTSVLRGLQAGKNVEQILHILQEHSQKELPQNVEYTLRDWTKTFKSVNVSQVLLFEVSSEDAGQILAAIPSLQDLGVRQLAPCIFAVSGSVNLQTVRKELEKTGVFVRISGDIYSRPKNPYESYVTYGRY
ncbi:MAG: hypothetical protein PVS3B3_24440 [Ktedonobacteraceae bacterium]